jgi:hypothetical protein
MHEIGIKQQEGCNSKRAGSHIEWKFSRWNPKKMSIKKPAQLQPAFFML